MKRVVCTALALAFALSAGLVSADEKPKRSPEEQFKRRDKDADGKLSLAEFVGKATGEKATKAETQFKKKDKNSDGFVSLEEFLPKKPKTN